MDFRLTRADARAHVLERDAALRARMPIFRARPPLTDADIDGALSYASARHAFWQSLEVPREVNEALASATTGQKIAYAVPYAHSDICNGGFHQFFSNSTGDFAATVTEMLVVLGEVERADVFKRAMSRFPHGVAPRSQSERRKLLAAIDYRSDWNPWVAPIEAAYYALDSELLRRRVDEWVSSHPEEFFLD